MQPSPKWFPVLRKVTLVAVLWLSAASQFREGQEEQVLEVFRKFRTEYLALNIPEFTFDYRTNFSNITALEHIRKQQEFFENYRKTLRKFDRKQLNPATALVFDQLAYEVDLNLERLDLEEDFRENKSGTVPASGLASLPDGKKWYQFYSRYYTGQTLSADEWMIFGEQEVKRVQGEIRRLRSEMGYARDSAGFYKFLNSDTFWLTDQAAIEQQYQTLQKTVGQNLQKLFPENAVPLVAINVWPQAIASMPPAYYYPGNPADGQESVFYYNFSGNRHNKRSMDWMFLHEGIPGHHLQFSLRNLKHDNPLQDLFYYPAVSEGWAAYVENLGKDVGLYQTPAQELGKREWDLVRSARVVLDAGMHGKGWTKFQALAYWKANVPGQENIAEREVTRCLNWPGQVLSYKAGERLLKDLVAMQKSKVGPAFSLKAFHMKYLNLGMLPPPVIRNAMLEEPLIIKPVP